MHLMTQNVAVQFARPTRAPDPARNVLQNATDTQHALAVPGMYGEFPRPSAPQDLAVRGMFVGKDMTVVIACLQSGDAIKGEHTRVCVVTDPAYFGVRSLPTLSTEQDTDARDAVADWITARWERPRR